MLKHWRMRDRLLILCQLINGARTVGELESLLGIRQPDTLEKTVLRQEGAGFYRTEREIHHLQLGERRSRSDHADVVQALLRE